jgi:hypothetical protein
MTQDEIIEMARQVYGDTGWTGSSIIRIEAFAKLVEEKATEKANARANASWTLMCEKMVAFEREACALLAEKLIAEEYFDVATEIRARG